MDLQQLRYIVALAQERHFQRAAKQSGVTQPTLSQQVKKLEEELGIPLFERSSRRVSLTPAGERFLPYAVAVLDSLAKGVREIREEATDFTGRLRLSAIPTIGPYLLPEIIMAMRKKMPRLVLELFEETTPDLLESLKKGRIDLGLLSTPVPDAGVVSRVLGHEEFYLGLSRRHPLAHQISVTPRDLKHEHLLILQEGHCFGEQSLEFCRRKRDDEQVIFQGSSLLSVLKLAATGEGVTFVPRMAVSSLKARDLVFLPFAASGRPQREVGVVWRISAPLDRASRLFLETADQVFRKRSGEKL